MGSPDPSSLSSALEQHLTEYVLVFGVTDQDRAELSQELTRLPQQSSPAPATHAGASAVHQPAGAAARFKAALPGFRIPQQKGTHAASSPAAETATARARNLKISLLERFPAVDRKDIPLDIPALPQFCFPEGALLDCEKPRGQTPAFFSFALTTEKALRLHVACLIVHERVVVGTDTFYMPKAFCLVSKLPCIQTFKTLLSDLVVAAGDRSGPSLVQEIVAQLFYEIPLPPDHTTQMVFSVGSRTLNLLDQTFSRDFSFRPLLACLSVQRLTQLILLLMLERKVVLWSRSASLALISTCCEIALALLFPFDWVHIYVPVLPYHLRRYLECPAPFLMGIVGDLTATSIPVDVTIFDLDKDRTVPLHPDLPFIPKALDELQRLGKAYRWEQKPGHRQYWSRYHLVNLSGLTAKAKLRRTIGNDENEVQNEESDRREDDLEGEDEEDQDAEVANTLLDADKLTDCATPIEGRPLERRADICNQKSHDPEVTSQEELVLVDAPPPIRSTRHHRTPSESTASQAEEEEPEAEAESLENKTTNGTLPSAVLAGKAHEGFVGGDRDNVSIVDSGAYLATKCTSESKQPPKRHNHRRIPSVSSMASATTTVASDESEDIDNELQGLPSEKGVMAAGPNWSEDQEQHFRQKVSATFLEVFVILFHSYPQYARKRKSSLSRSIGIETAQQKDDDANDDTGCFDQEGFLKHVRKEVGPKVSDGHVATLTAIMDTNLWEDFSNMPPDHPRLQLFKQAIFLYHAWCQEPSQSRKPFHEDLRAWVARLYEPTHTVVAPSRGARRPEIKARKRSRYSQVAKLGLASVHQMADVAHGHIDDHGTRLLPVLAAAISPIPRRKDLHMPSEDPADLFARAMTSALDAMRRDNHESVLARVLRQLATPPRERGFQHEAIGQSEPSFEHALSAPSVTLSPPGYLTVEELMNMIITRTSHTSEIVVSQPRLRVTCMLSGVREVRNLCPICKWSIAFWDVLRCALIGPYRNDGECATECVMCGGIWQPELGLARKRTRETRSKTVGAAVATDTPASTHTVPNITPKIPLIGVDECLARIAAGSLGSLKRMELAETAPEVYWCLHMFFGLRVELFSYDGGLVEGVPPLQRIGCTTFETLCQQHLELERRSAMAGTVDADADIVDNGSAPMILTAGLAEDVEVVSNSTTDSKAVNIDCNHTSFENPEKVENADDNDTLGPTTTDEVWRSKIAAGVDKGTELSDIAGTSPKSPSRRNMNLCGDLHLYSGLGGAQGESEDVNSELFPPSPVDAISAAVAAAAAAAGYVSPSGASSAMASPRVRIGGTIAARDVQHLQEDCKYSADAATPRSTQFCLSPGAGSTFDAFSSEGLANSETKHVDGGVCFGDSAGQGDAQSLQEILVGVIGSPRRRTKAMLSEHVLRASADVALPSMSLMHVNTEGAYPQVRRRDPAAPIVPAPNQRRRIRQMPVQGSLGCDTRVPPARIVICLKHDAGGQRPTQHTQGRAITAAVPQTRQRSFSLRNTPNLSCRTPSPTLRSQVSHSPSVAKEDGYGSHFRRQQDQKRASSIKGRGRTTSLPPTPSTHAASPITASEAPCVGKKSEELLENEIGMLSGHITELQERLDFLGLRVVPGDFDDARNAPVPSYRQDPVPVSGSGIAARARQALHGSGSGNWPSERHASTPEAAASSGSEACAGDVQHAKSSWRSSWRQRRKDRGAVGTTRRAESVH